MNKKIKQIIKTLEKINIIKEYFENKIKQQKGIINERTIQTRI